MMASPQIFYFIVFQGLIKTLSVLFKKINKEVKYLRKSVPVVSTLTFLSMCDSHITYSSISPFILFRGKADYFRLNRSLRVTD